MKTSPPAFIVRAIDAGIQTTKKCWWFLPIKNLHFIIPDFVILYFNNVIPIITLFDFHRTYAKVRSNRQIKIIERPKEGS